jgi:hypothetical protein
VLSQDWVSMPDMSVRARKLHGHLDPHAGALVNAAPQLDFSLTRQMRKVRIADDEIMTRQALPGD